MEVEEVGLGPEAAGQTAAHGAASPSTPSSPDLTSQQLEADAERERPRGESTILLERVRHVLGADVQDDSRQAGGED